MHVCIIYFLAYIAINILLHRNIVGKIIIINKQLFEKYCENSISYLKISFNLFYWYPERNANDTIYDDELVDRYRKCMQIKLLFGRLDSIYMQKQLNCFRSIFYSALFVLPLYSRGFSRRHSRYDWAEHPLCYLLSDFSKERISFVVNNA